MGYFIKNCSIKETIKQLEKEHFYIGFDLHQAVEYIFQALRVSITKFYLTTLKTDNFGKGRNVICHFEQFDDSDSKDKAIDICYLYDTDTECSRFVVMREKGKFDVSGFFNDISKVNISKPDSNMAENFAEEFSSIRSTILSLHGKISNNEEFVFFLYEALFKLNVQSKFKNEKLKIICKILEQFPYSPEDLKKYNMYENPSLE